jgi:hypothetical protein
MQTKVAWAAAAALFVGGALFGHHALVGDGQQKEDAKKFQVPRDAIKGAIRAVDQAKNTFTIAVDGKKERTFSVGKNTEFWGPNGGDRGTGPKGLKDDCMAVGYEIHVVAIATDGMMAKDVYLSPRKPVDSKKPAKAKEFSDAAHKRIANAIASGHSYQKHVIEEKLFPEVKSEKDFVLVIAKVLASPTHHRDLENDRQAFYDIKSNTIVIYNPHAKDNGTCFRPNAGLKYFENLK